MDGSSLEQEHTVKPSAARHQRNHSRCFADVDLVEPLPRTARGTEVDGSSGVTHIEPPPFHVAIFKQEIAAGRRASLSPTRRRGNPPPALPIGGCPLQAAAVVPRRPVAQPLQAVDQDRCCAVTPTQFLTGVPDFDAVHRIIPAAGDTPRRYRKWFDDILDAQDPNGHVPDFAPTSGWGRSRPDGSPGEMAYPW
jgi:hypothetical protein